VIGGVQGVRISVRLAPYNVADDPKPQPQDCAPEAEDDVVRATYPQRAIGLEDELWVTPIYRTFTRGPS
jgi:hypothetical protein